MEMTERSFDLGVMPETFASVYPRLYHMAHEDAWPQIQRHGLLSTRSILDLWEVETTQRARIEGQIRPAAVELSHPRHGKVVIRDQKPMNEKKLRTALIDCTPQDLVPALEWQDLLLALHPSPQYTHGGQGQPRKVTPRLDLGQLSFRQIVRAADHSMRNEFGKHNPLPPETWQELIYEHEPISIRCET